MEKPGMVQEIARQQAVFYLRDSIKLTSDQLAILTLPNILLASFAFVVIVVFDVEENLSGIETTTLVFAYITSVTLLLAALLSVLLRIHLLSIPVGSRTDGRTFVTDNSWAVFATAVQSGMGFLAFVALLSLLIYSRLDAAGLKVSLLSVTLPLGGLFVLLFWLFITYKTDPAKYFEALSRHLPDPSPELLTFIEDNFEGLATPLAATLATACAKHRVTPEMLEETAQKKREQLLRDIGMVRTGERYSILSVWCCSSV